jgi:hypothetical protein
MLPKPPKLSKFTSEHEILLMKSLYVFLLSFALLCGATTLKADIATPGEQDVYIELLNGNAFPKYKFFIKYQTYHYDMGYKPGGVEVVDITPGKHFMTGDRGAQSFLYARGPKGEWKSAVEVGGSAIDYTDGVQYMLDRIKIKKLNPKGKVIEIEVMERQAIGEGGAVLQTIKKSAVELPTSMIWILPLACGLGLVLFFVFRRKAARPA